MGQLTAFQQAKKSSTIYDCEGHLINPDGQPCEQMLAISVNEWGISDEKVDARIACRFADDGFCWAVVICDGGTTGEPTIG